MLRSELQQVLDQLWQGESIDQERVESHLLSMWRMNPDVFDAVVSYLSGVEEGGAVELSSIAQRVHERTEQ